MKTLTRALPPPDSFVQNIHVHIETHLSDATLNVKRLLRLVAMSRSDLHRKLDRTVGMSATAYLRYVRLQQAAKLLLHQPTWGIYKVALEVGFSSQSYFTRRFREVFGCCPAKWRERSVNLEHTC